MATSSIEQEVEDIARQSNRIKLLVYAPAIVFDLSLYIYAFVAPAAPAFALLACVISLISVFYVWSLLNQTKFLAYVIQSEREQSVVETIGEIPQDGTLIEKLASLGRSFNKPRIQIFRFKGWLAQIGEQTVYNNKRKVIFLLIIIIAAFAVIQYLAALVKMPPLINIGAFLILILSLVIFLVLVIRLYDDYLEVIIVRLEPSLKCHIDSVLAIFPKKVRVGDSHSIVLHLAPPKDSGNEKNDADESLKSNERIEVELQAAGMSVDGEKRVQLVEFSDLLKLVWNCYFANTGSQTVNLVISLVKPSSSPSEVIRDVISHQKYEIRVNSLLRVSWQPILVSLLSILSAAIAIMQAVRV